MIHSNEEIKLILQGLKLNEDSQKEFNKSNYGEAFNLKNEAINILCGFSKEDINSVLILINKKVVVVE